MRVCNLSGASQLFVHLNHLRRQLEHQRRLFARQRAGDDLRIALGFRSYQMRQHDRRNERGLSVLAREAEDGAARLARIVVNVEDEFFLERRKPDALPDPGAFGNATVFFDERNDALAARRVSLRRQRRARVRNRRRSFLRLHVSPCVR